jgi:hypothetical protein
VYIKKLSWWSSLKKWFTGLYLVAVAFIMVGVILLLPLLKNTVWQTIGGALLGSGLTILIASITTKQSSFEQYKKEANLQRKTDVYGPLHAELKVLREAFDTARARAAPYPRWIEMPGVERPSSLRFAQTTLLLAFSYWPTFKADYHVDDFSPAAQKLLNEVQNLAVAYGTAVEDARKAMQDILRPHIADSITKEEQRSHYQEWMRKRTSNALEHNRWFEFILQQITTISLDYPPGEDLSRAWSAGIGWLLAGNPGQAALGIYSGDAINWDAAQHVSLAWFQDIFEATANELKSDQTYLQAQDAQKELFTKLQEAETLLYQGLTYIRDRYEGGAPPV